MAETSNGRGIGSRLHGLNVWTWRYGRGQPRKVTVAEAVQMRKERLAEARRRAAETLKRRPKDRSGPGEMEDSEADK